MTDLDGRTGLAVSPLPSGFAPLLFAGRLEEGVRIAAELGFAAVELSLRAPDDVDPGALASMLQDNGLVLSAIATGQACLVDSLCLGSADAEDRKAAEDRILGAVELAAPFDAAVIVGGIRGRLAGSPAQQRSLRAGALDAIRRCARRASQVGVTVLLEPINRYETNFVNTAAEGLAVLEELGEPSMKLLLDTFHMNIEERTFADALCTAGDRLGYVHVADSNRRAPGQGHIDFAEVMGTLDAIAYRGMLVAEVLPLPDDLGAARLTAAFWAQVAARGPEEISGSRRPEGAP
ncbi:MAG TPA: sugar phosphate isomerase/epimerase family protein [Acidimicrobiales bacterium]|nr:sugar phosphate isomerase/epimerase family protein [Acidimicrobiales bacterium]